MLRPAGVWVLHILLQGRVGGPSRLFRAGESRRAWHSAMLHSAQEGGCISSGIAQALLINSGSPAPAS